jgi:glycosyltransferase involved in cell wall biosynthesis
LKKGEALLNKINNIQEEESPNINNRLNIGFISIWFERGQSYVTKIIRDCLSKNHNTFIFARTGGVYGEAKLENKGIWDVPNLTTYPEYKIPGNIIKNWINDNNLHTVIFNEEYDWDLVRAAKETGVKVITYLDYYKDEWKHDIGLYDVVMCSTLRTYNLVKNICSAYYIGWGVDTDLFKPNNEEPEFTFFHNAGWLGINYRKMTPAVIAAFDSISRVLPNFNLFIHSQVKLEMLPPVVTDIVRKNPNIVFHEETVPAPGLYHKGKIMLFPTKLEGLGLPLFEALSSGLPVITTNAPPMNEFIRDGYNGLLVNVAFRTTRNDNVAFPEEIIDMGDLAIKMAKLANNDTMCKTLSRNARLYSEENLSLSLLSKRILNIFNR